MNNKGLTGIEVVAVVALLGGALYLVVPSIFPGASKRAKQSTEATKAVEEANKHQAAVVAASVVKMGEVAHLVENVPVKSFLIEGSCLALSRRPTPDAKELLEAEKRKNAFLSGQLAVKDKLYAEASGETIKLRNALEKANIERRAVDLELEKAAAAEHAQFTQKLAIGGIALVFLAGFVYLKVMNMAPDTAGKSMADIRAGVKLTKAFDANLSPRFYSRIRKATKLATEPKDD